MRRMLVSSVFLALLSPLAWAEAPPAPEKAAEQAAQAWLALTDAGQCAAAWQASASLFRNAISSDAWCQASMAARTPLGAMRTRKVKSATFMTTAPGAPDGKYVVIVFDTTFEKKATAQETVTPMLDADGTWRVSGYYIR
jgi:hypothetical protein